VSFTWTVNATTTGTTSYSGTIRLVKLGLCLDDRYNSSTPGAVVQVWGCNGRTNQQWQVMSNGTIQHDGLCLDARGSGTTSGTKVQLWTCTGNANQQWGTSDWHLEYNNPKASDEVLDDTGWGGSGTQQDIWTNNGGANQVWATW
jgi:chitinase